MGYNSVVVSVLALSALAAAVPSVGDNSLDAGERVVLVSPVLAPPRDSRLHDTTRSRQFPILMLLAQQLEDQEQTGHNRQKRHFQKTLGIGGGGLGNSGGHGGGYGGGYSGGYQGGSVGHGGGYQMPSKVIIVKVVKGHGHGGGHRHGGYSSGGNRGGYSSGGNRGGYNNGGGGCGGGCGGNGGYSGSSATATATATATANAGYGKR